MIDAQEFKNKLLNASPLSSNDAEFRFNYFFNGRLIGTNDHQHFEVIGLPKLNTVYPITNHQTQDFILSLLELVG